MNRQHVVDLQTRNKPELQARFGVTRLALFGSTARDTATSGSDVDVLVAFDGPGLPAPDESAPRDTHQLRRTPPERRPSASSQ
jgi:predicted nucleotidyltransferase